MEKDNDKLFEVRKRVIPWPYILMKEFGQNKILMIQANKILEKTSVTIFSSPSFWMFTKYYTKYCLYIQLFEAQRAKNSTDMFQFYDLYFVIVRK